MNFLSYVLEKKPFLFKKKEEFCDSVKVHPWVILHFEKGAVNTYGVAWSYIIKYIL